MHFEIVGVDVFNASAGGENVDPGREQGQTRTAEADAEVQ
jgi:hypothetical protein